MWASSSRSPATTAVSAVLAVAIGVACGGAAAAETASRIGAGGRLEAYTVVGDSIPAPLGGAPGDAARGRAIVVDRQRGLCLLCHSGPFPEERFQGTLAPDLRGAGKRWSEGQLRLRIVDSRRIDARSIMPPYHRIDGLKSVGERWSGRPLLDAQQIEDVIAFLRTLDE